MITKAIRAFEAMAPLRRRRARNCRYAYGNQWDDPTPAGATEGQLLERDGKFPVSVNLINRVVRMLVGRFCSDSDDIYDAIDRNTVALNSLRELDARLFEEFIVSGCAVQRISRCRRPAGTGVWVDNVSPDRFFVNRYSDPRGLDIDLIGMIDSLTFEQFVNRFATRRGLPRLREIFRAGAGGGDSLFSDLYAHSIPLDDEHIAVVEAWSYEARGSMQKAPFDMCWRHRCFAPDGNVLAEETVDRHPFAVKIHPLIDGVPHSYVESLIDRQRSLNRMLTTFEATAACAAKGVLLFPMNQLVHGMDMNNVGELWARPDSVIPVTGMGDREPRQIVTNAANTGIVPIVDMQLRLFDEAAGITDVLKGASPGGNLSAEARQAIIDNAATATADITGTFRRFLLSRRL